MDLTVTDLMTVAGGAVVITIILQGIKQWIRADLVPVSAWGLGILLAEGAALVTGVRSPELLANAALAGLLAGSSATGLYAAQRPLGLLGPKT